MNLNNYLEKVKGSIAKVVRTRKSKVEGEIVSLVGSLIKENKPTLLKDIAKTLNKPTQQIHQIVRKSKVIKKVKVEGRTLIVPFEMN